MGFFGPSIFAPPPAVAYDVSFHLPPAARPPCRRRPARSPPALPLPPELVLAIIEHAACRDGDGDQTLLRHCALVCKAWAVPAQRLLFTSVSLRSQSACEAFLAAGRTLRDAVVRLCAVVDDNQPGGLSQHALALAISRCPRLYHVSLSLYGGARADAERMPRAAGTLDDCTLSLLLSGPRISSLHLTNWSDNSHALAQLLAVWPGLHTLSITATSPPSPPSPSTAPVLSSLRINFQSLPTLDFLHWLTHRASLRILEFEREPPTQVLHTLIDAHGAHLHSLALPACTHSEHARALQSCSQLRELRIETLGPCVAGKVLRALPPTVEHVALGVDLNTPLQLLVDLVKARAGHAEALRALTLYTINGGEKHASFNPLKMACAVTGVQLRVVDDVRTFREQLRGDPVPASSSFPRVKSLNNIYIMRSASAIS